MEIQQNTRGEHAVNKRERKKSLAGKPYPRIKQPRRNEHKEARPFY